MKHLEPGLLIVFGNQFWISFERVEAVDAQSAARGPRFYDGLIELLRWLFFE